MARTGWLAGESFDYQAFRARFVAGKRRQRGYEQGYVADPDSPLWWRDGRLWREQGHARSETEYTALERIFRVARIGQPLTTQEQREEFGATVLREVFLDLRAEREARERALKDARRNLPLRDLHALNGLTVEWIPTGHRGDALAVVVPLMEGEGAR